MSSLSPICEKCLRLALDAGAAPGEAENAAVAFVRKARDAGLEYDDVVNDTVSTSDGPPPAVEVVMPFGKHRGRSLGDIAKNHIGYLHWLTTIDLQPPLRSAVAAVISYYGSE